MTAVFADTKIIIYDYANDPLKSPIAVTATRPSSQKFSKLAHPRSVTLSPIRIPSSSDCPRLSGPNALTVVVGISPQGTLNAAVASGESFHYP